MTRIQQFLVAMALLGLSACQPALRANVTTYHNMSLPPKGESFVVLPLDTEAKMGEMEFNLYAAVVSEHLANMGYRSVSQGGKPDLKVYLGLYVSNERLRYSHIPTSYHSLSMGWGWGHRYGRYYNPWWMWGYGGSWPWYRASVRRVYEHTVRMDIFKSSSQEGASDKLYEGRASAVSYSRHFRKVQPQLIGAIFKKFPGNSGETVRVTVKNQKSKK